MSYIALANITLSSAQSSVTFSNIPTSVNGTALRDLVIVFNGSTSAAGVAINMRPNSDSANGSGVFMYAVNTPATFTSGSGGGMSLIYTDNTARYSGTAQFFDFAQTDKHKTILTRTGSGDPANGSFVWAFAQRWASTTAISSIQLITSSSTITQGSTFALYGIAG